MRIKIILPIIGVAVPVACLAVYWGFNGSPILPTTGGVTSGVAPITADAGNRGILLETRDIDGRLLKDLAAAVVVHRPDGREDLTAVTANFYMKGGRRALVTADRGTVTIEQTGTLNGRPFPKDGTLSGHVMLTIGPLESFIAGSSERQAGQTQARLDEDVHFQFDTRELTTPGAVHVQGDARGQPFFFDGRDMTLMVSSDQRRIDFLRFEKLDRFILKDAAKAGLGDLAPDAKTAGAPPAAPTAPVTPVVPATPAGPTGTGAQVATGTQPADGTVAATVYTVDLSQDVKMNFGVLSLAADTVNLVMQFGQDDVDAPTDNASAATAPAGGRSNSSSPPATAPAAPAVAAGHPGALETATANPGQDLVVVCTGPIVIKPLAEGQASPLVNAKDKHLTAVGSLARPVVIKDGPTVTARAGIFEAFAAEQRGILLPGAYQTVTAQDTTRGDLACKGIEFLQAENVLHIAGPGNASVKATVLRHDAAPDAKPLLASWRDSVVVNLATIADPADSTKTIRVVKHATLAGAVVLHDPEPDRLLEAELLDVALTNIGGTKDAALEHMVAQRNVTVQSTRTLPDGRVLPPDFIQGQRLELSTAISPGTPAPQPDKLRVDGNVMAQTWLPGAVDAATGRKKYSRQQIETPLLMVDLMPKDPKAKADPSDVAGGMAVRAVHARNTAHLLLEGLAKDVVDARCQSMDADNIAGTADLMGNSGPNPAQFSYADIHMGDDQIRGNTIHLDQKANSIFIPGNGDFIFMQPSSNPVEKPSPVQVVWSKQMSYSGKDNLATFEGDTHTELLGKPDQQSQLVADTLLVKLAPSAPAAGAAAADPADPNSPGGRKLQEITALGHVKAAGATFDPQGTLLTRMLLKNVNELVYTEATRNMHVIGKGELGLEDYRPQAVATAPATGPGNNTSTRGATAFQWTQGLIYDGDTGLLTMTKDVRMLHQPTHPIKLEPDKPDRPHSATATAPATAPAPPQIIELQCQNLVATLTSTSSAPAAMSSPVALGNNGQMKVNKVTATTAAQLTVDKDMLSADTLDFDAQKNIALATSKGDNWAQVVQAEKGVTEARKIQWNFTTGEMNVQNPRIQMTVPVTSGFTPVPMQH